MDDKKTVFLFSLVAVSVVSVVLFVSNSFVDASVFLMIACCGFILLVDEKKFDNVVVAGVLFFFIALAFSMPIFKDTYLWGGRDWDQHYAFSYIPLHSFLHYHQIPLWNPYMCGGMPLIADPQVQFFSIQVIPLLIFGLGDGIRVNILLHLWFAMVGMWLVAKHFRLNGVARLFPPFVYALCGVYFKHVSRGHYTWLAHAWVPFVLYFFLEGLRDRRKLFLCAASLSFIFFNGNVNYLSYALLLIGSYALFHVLFSFRKSPTLRSTVKPFFALVMVVLAFMLLSAVKFFPIVEYSMTQPRLYHDVRSITVTDIVGHLTQFNTFHEGNAFIGWIALSIILFGVVLKWRSALSLVFTTIVFVLVVLNANSPIPIWLTLNENLPLYKSLRTPRRAISIIVLLSSVFGGYAIDYWKGRRLFFARLLLLIVLVNLFTVTAKPFHKAFRQEPYSVAYENQQFMQVKRTRVKTKYKIHYPLFHLVLANKGAVNCYNIMAPKAMHRGAKPFGSKRYKGELYVVGDGALLNYSITPNVVYFTSNNTNDSRIVLNQNYVKGWKSDVGSVEEYRNLVSVVVPKGINEVKLYYLPTSFILGAIISAISWITLTAVFWRSFRLGL